MSSYYAWSDIKAGPAKEESDSDVKVVKAGEPVSAADLGVSDEEFEALVESGAVREEEYPELPEGYTGSPAQHKLEQEAAQAQMDEAQAVLDKGKEEEAEAAAVAKETAKAEKAATTNAESK